MTLVLQFIAGHRTYTMCNCKQLFFYFCLFLVSCYPLVPVLMHSCPYSFLFFCTCILNYALQVKLHCLSLVLLDFHFFLLIFHFCKVVVCFMYGLICFHVLAQNFLKFIQNVNLVNSAN